MPQIKSRNVHFQKGVLLSQKFSTVVVILLRNILMDLESSRCNFGFDIHVVNPVHITSRSLVWFVVVLSLHCSLFSAFLYYNDLQTWLLFEYKRRLSSECEKRRNRSELHNNVEVTIVTRVAVGFRNLFLYEKKMILVPFILCVNTRLI